MKNVCIVGFGAIGKTHAEALLGVERARLYAVCDIDNERLKIAQKQYENIVVYKDFDEMLCDEMVDSVHICTPHYLHFEMIKNALAKGKCVICEKPVVMTKQEFDSLLKLKNADKVGVAFQNRLNPCVVKMKELVASGELGEVIGAKGIVTWSRTKEYYASSDWRGKWATEGGGVLINQAIHTFDYFGFVLGKIKSLKANMTNFSLENDIEVEDTFSASVELENGAKCVFFATNAYGGNSKPEFEIKLEKGDLKYVGDTLTLNGEIIERDSGEFIGKVYWGAGHKGVMKNYYDLNKLFSPFDTKETMYGVYAMYESAKDGGKKIVLGGKSQWK